MMKHSLGVKDLSNSYLHAKFNEVVTLFRELSLATGFGGDVLILEDVGTTLIQKSWTDETGWFVTYRLHPIYSHTPKLVEASMHAQSRLVGILGGSAGKMRVERENEADRNTRITVFLGSSEHSIGD